MNEHYALDPALGNISSRDLRSFLRLFGLDQGRFLAKYPEDWPRRLTQHVGALPELEKKRILELWRANRLTLRLIPDLAYNDALPWERNVDKVLNRPNLLREAFARPGNAFGWRTVGDLLDGVGGDLPDGRGAHVPMNARAYADCVEPLFTASEEVTLVDPYFFLSDGSKSDDGRTQVLKTLVSLAAQTTVRCIRLICSQEQLSEQMKLSSKNTIADFQRLVHQCIACNEVKVPVQIKQKREVGHGRYIFSRYGGLQFDHGFCEGPRGKENHVHWLSENELKPLLARFNSTRC